MVSNLLILLLHLFSCLVYMKFLPRTLALMDNFIFLLNYVTQSVYDCTSVLKHNLSHIPWFTVTQSAHNYICVRECQSYSMVYM